MAYVLACWILAQYIQFFQKDRGFCRAGGGVAAFVNHKWRVVDINLDDKYSNLELICFDIYIMLVQNCVFYCVPATLLQHRCAQLYESIDRMFQEIRWWRTWKTSKYNYWWFELPKNLLEWHDLRQRSYQHNFVEVCYRRRFSPVCKFRNPWKQHLRSLIGWW